MMDLKIKDKIFIGIMLIGVFFVLVEKITPGKEKKFNELPKNQVIVNNKAILAEVAERESDLTKGLGGHDSMTDDEGMLFVHALPGYYVYTMREMKFGLDFIFINENKVVDLVKNVPFDYQGDIRGAVQYSNVLEVNAGFIDRYEIRIEDDVQVE